MNDALAHRIVRSPPLPSLPKVALDVLALTEDPEVALPSMARVVARDPALVAKILKTVNSSVYHLSHQIANLDRALVVLGLEGVKTLVLGFSLVGDLKRMRTRGAFDHMAYWRRSLYAGTAAKILAEEFRMPLVEEAFLSALLMDIGMLALDRVLGKEYGEIVTSAGGHEELCAMETAKIKMTHAEAVGLLAKQWKLPEMLAIPMAHHHSPQTVQEPALQQLADVVCLAGRCADLFVDAQPEWSLNDVRKTLMERHRVSDLTCGAILAKIGMRTRELAPLFDISMEGAADYDTILKRASDGLTRMTAGIALPTTAAPQDKRRAPRIAREGMIFVYPFRHGAQAQGLRARFKDVSAQGVGVILQQPLQAGDQFVIRLPRKNGEPASILYTVVRCERKGEHEFRIGAELVCVMGREPTPGKKPPDDRRNLERIRRAILSSN